jgi:hypothetical protein
VSGIAISRVHWSDCAAGILGKRCGACSSSAVCLRSEKSIQRTRGDQRLPFAFRRATRPRASTQTPICAAHDLTMRAYWRVAGWGKWVSRLGKR